MKKKKLKTNKKIENKTEENEAKELVGEDEEKNNNENDKQNRKDEDEYSEKIFKTEDELLKNIEKSLDVSNIIDEPILSFGINNSKLLLKEDMTNEEEEEEELKEEEEERKNEEFMNKIFEILRSETPINDEKIDEFVDYFANDNNNEELQADLSDGEKTEESINLLNDDDEEKKK
jgi:membrane-associated HD superfamily phosphohydrolase